MAPETTERTPSLIYLYGVVRPDFDAARAPPGLDDHRAELVPGVPFGALVSRLPREEYAPEVIEKRSGEMDWIGPRATAHDRVLTWAQEHGGIIPMSMFSMWSDADALQESLGKRADEFRRAFERVANADEYGLRVHRRDREMLARIHELDERIAALRSEADVANPGQRYLLERKIAEESKLVIRSVSQRLAREIFDAVRAVAREAVTRPVAPASAAAPEATMVLNAAFLVDRGRLEEFRSEVTRQMRSGEPRGLSFDFTGPWPPYNFVA